MLMHLFFWPSQSENYRNPLIENALNDKSIERMCG